MGKDSGIILDYKDNDDSNFSVTPSKSKHRRARKSSAGMRTIQYEWNDEEISRLIALVKAHRELWHFASPQYKLPKIDGWQSVVDELNIDGVDAHEAKVKFGALRNTYMGNLSKLRLKPSQRVRWRFFKTLMFLEENGSKYSIHPALTQQLDSKSINSSIEEEASVSQPLSEDLEVGNQSKRLKYKTTNSIRSRASSACSSSSEDISNPNTAAPALRSPDTNSTFCDNLLAELRTLSETRARTLRYKISRLMMDFIEAKQ